MHVEIPKAQELEQRVFAIQNEKDFSSIALMVYDFQFHNNPVYQQYCLAVKREPGRVQNLEDIPFLPISFFKTHRVETTSFEPELLFKSSGTTASTTSTHYVKKAQLYRKSFLEGFRKFYGNPEDYCFLGLLPNYLQRGQSSLVYMVQELMKVSAHPENGFYLDELESLSTVLKRLEAAGQKTILFGVTYALLEFGNRFPMKLNHTLVMETGGMKGRGRELTRSELYEALKTSLGLQEVHSEYGMTELLSQGYAVDGLYETPPWMKIVLRDETDPFDLVFPPARASGAINVMDLANLYSCSFIATEDIGRRGEDGRFEVLGRMDHSDIRGCSLMVI